MAVDNSFSMQAKGRWEALRPWAVDALASLKDGDQMGILLMNPAPRWLIPLAAHNATGFRTTLAGMGPGYETTRYDATLRLAGDTLARSGSKDLEIVWMGDEQRLGWSGVDFSHALPDGVTLLLPPIPDAPKRQAAITRAWWEGAGPSAALRVAISQFIPLHDTRTLTVFQNGSPLAHREVALDAGKENSVIVPLAGVADGQGLRIQLDPDDLPVDDVFYIVRDAGPQARVRVAPLEGAPGGFDFLSSAINATRRMTSAPLKAEDLPDAEWPAHDVVLVRGSKPFEAPLVDRLDRFLKAGGPAWIFLNGSPAQTEWMKRAHLEVKPSVPETSDGPLYLRNWNADHPLLAPLADNLAALLSVEFYHGYSLAGIDATPLATWADGSYALAEVNSEGRHFLVSGFDLDREATNWPLQASFVPFVHSAVLWLSQQRPVSSAWRVGEEIALPGDGTWEALDTPQPLPASKVTGSVRPEMPGLYRYRGGAQSVLYAVNLRPEESDLAPWATPKDFLALSAQAEGAHPQPSRGASLSLSEEEAEGQQRGWLWLLALAFLLILAELRLSNRTSS